MKDFFHESGSSDRPRSTSRRPILLLAGALGLYVLFFARPWTPPLLEGWESDFEAAVSQASSTNRHLLVAFSMAGCPPCRMMDRQVLNTTEVRTALESFVPVHIDVDRQPEIASRFEVLGTPMYAVVDAKGNLLARCTGYQPVDAFVEFLRRASRVRLDAPYGVTTSTGD